MIASPQFTSISDFKNGYAKIAKGSKFGIIDKNGNIIIKPIYDDVTYFAKENIAAVKINSKWGIANSNGTIILNPRFDFIYDFQDGFLKVRENNKYGFLNSKGNIFLIPSFQDASDFQDGYASVKSGSTWKLVDENGNFQYLGFHEMKQPSKGIVPVEKNKKWGIVKTDGTALTPLKYDDISFLNSKLIKVKDSGKWGIIDYSGNEILGPQFDSITATDGEMSLIVKSGRYGVIDSSGKILVEPKYSFIDNYREGKAIVISLSGDYGFIDSLGNATMKSEFDNIYAFHNGLARVEKDGKFGFIDENGKTVIEPTFDMAYDFTEGCTCVREITGALNDRDPDTVEKYVKWRYIDTLGSSLINQDFNSATNFDKETALALDDGKCVIIKMSNIKTLSDKETKDPYKAWEIHFNKPLNDKTEKDSDDNIIQSIDMTMQNNIEVKDENENYKDVSFEFKSPNTIVINPPFNGYEKNTEYTIIILDNIESTSGKKLSFPITKMNFKVLP